MSPLVNEDGSLKTYVVVDLKARTIIGAFNWAGEASKGLAALRKDATGELALHNLTHNACPEWLKDLIRSDAEYCRGKADTLDARAVGLRARAAELVSQAEEQERLATRWRERAEVASAPGGPTI